MAAALLPNPLWDVVEPFVPISSTTVTWWAAASFESRVPDWDCLRTSQRHSLGNAPAGTRLRTRHACRGSPSVVPGTGAVWAGGDGSWSGPLRGSANFVVGACGMTSEPTSMRLFSRLDAR